MRRIFSIILILTGITTQLFAQVAINTDNSQPDNSAMLDIQSADKGVLIPRMTQSQLYAITNPAEGLMVFCTDCGSGDPGAVAVYIHDQWMLVSVYCLVPQSPVAGTHIAGITQINWNWNPVQGATGYKWNSINDYATATNLGTNTSFTQTGLNCNQTYSAYVWAYNVCGASPGTTLTQTTLFIIPPAPVAGTHIPSLYQIVWNWFAAPDATGYKWNTTNDYGSAVNVGANISKTETGLDCNTQYTRYVWAYTPCGTSSSTIMTQTTTGCPPTCEPFTDTRNGKLYHTALIGTQCWMKENLDIGTRIDGSESQTDNGILEKYCYNDLESNCTIYGGLYQWGEVVQYLNGASNNTTWDPVPTGHVTGICPPGWHIPTDAEWSALTTFLGGIDVSGGKLKETGTTHWSSPNAGATNVSGFTAFAGGYRLDNGIFNHRRDHGYFTSSTQNTVTNIWTRELSYGSDDVFRNGTFKYTGFSLRCLKDE